MINDDFLYISYVSLCSLFVQLKMKKIFLDNFWIFPIAWCTHTYTPPKTDIIDLFWAAEHFHLYACWPLFPCIKRLCCATHKTSFIIWSSFVKCFFLHVRHGLLSSGCIAVFFLLLQPVDFDFVLFTTHLIPFDGAPLHFSCIRLSSMPFIVRL